MIISIALQFIPTFLEETELIRMAQIVRGARFESRNCWSGRRASAGGAGLHQLRRADELAWPWKRTRLPGTGRGGKRNPCAQDYWALCGLRLPLPGPVLLAAINAFTTYVRRAWHTRDRRV